jgi:lycopene beta-cyclase
MTDCDFAILRGGAAGLSLALALAQSSPGTGKNLLVEKDSKDRNDRTWCYWTRQETPTDKIRYKVWRNVRFTSDQIDLRIPLRRSFISKF